MWVCVVSIVWVHLHRASPVLTSYVLERLRRNLHKIVPFSLFSALCTLPPAITGLRECRHPLLGSSSCCFSRVDFCVLEQALPAIFSRSPSSEFTAQFSFAAIIPHLGPIHSATHTRETPSPPTSSLSTTPSSLARARTCIQGPAYSQHLAVVGSHLFHFYLTSPLSRNAFTVPS